MAQDNPLPLSQRLESPHLELRRQAIREVFESRSIPSGSIVAVLRLVADRDDQVRGWACESLDQYVSAAPESVSAAPVYISATPEEVAAVIAELRTTNDGEIQYWATTLLERVGPAAAAAIAVLADVLLDSSCLAARERAAKTLAILGPAARPALNSLRQIGSDDPPRLRRLAESAIAAMSQRAA